MYLIYLITGRGLTPLLIPAPDLQDAIKAAKLINPGYNNGSVSDLCNNF